MRRLFSIVFLVALAALMGPALAQDKPVEEGFAPLFNGKDLTGWQEAVEGYKVEEGAIVCRKSGNLYTEKEYGDFVLRFEFKLPPGGNNGVGIRAPLKGDAAYVGMEIQVLDDSHPSYKGIKDYQSHGSIYGVVAAKRGALKPTGEWNEQEIMAKGSKIKITLNGTVIVDADIAPFAEGKEKTLDGGKHPGLSRTTGYIGFLGHGSPVAFKNLRIKEIK